MSEASAPSDDPVHSRGLTLSAIASRRRPVHIRMARPLSDRDQGRNRQANRRCDRRRAPPPGMSSDEEIVYDFTTELQKNKRVSDATFDRAEQRFGKKGVIDMAGIGGYYTFLAMQLNMALSIFGRRLPSGALSELSAGR